ncbi:rRNA maturation RNase YbeY [Atopomonas sediminilitoris]|uniref:rRNA maturation RNase YbeY n=1 Tax=Atopomonas sediminilitoris TaxID=2919919 RepID=UPI001F4E7222|nr:rRNA maturation RNase YbeY [Atopomonas sediminilitoris]MCJ8170669.1 rRNA maturation RNase YbeY [Atopomonas sediminilitoris]
MSLIVDVEVACDDSGVPSPEQFERWCSIALREREDTELAIRIVDTDEGRELNNTYRHKDYATNVLSFPADLPAELNLPLLGDLAICAPVVLREAGEQQKTVEAHWAHMVIHGCLHLLGYDHIDDGDAEVMEALERQLLAELGYPDPYHEEE